LRQAPPRTPAVQTLALEKRFGRAAALQSVDLRLDEGDFVALLGPNGAGKTTLIRILATLARPTAGKVLIGGLDLTHWSAQVRRLIGVVSHQSFLYRDLTVAENLALHARLYGLSWPEEQARAALERVGLEQRASDLVRTLSRGQVQRLSIARAVLHEPPILLLDEPYAGLDPQAAAGFTRMLQELALRGRTVLLATHELEQGLELAGRVAILIGGRLAYEQPVRGLGTSDLRRLYLQVVDGARR